MPDFHEAPAAVARALDIARTASKPVGIADAQDNTGGGLGDTTGLLKAMIAAPARRAVIGTIIDAQRADTALAVGKAGPASSQSAADAFRATSRFKCGVAAWARTLMVGSPTAR